MLRSIAVRISGFFLLAFVGGCGPDVKTMVTFNKASSPTLGKVGIVCVYEPCGPVPGILNLLAGQSAVELFREASPAEELREKFAGRIAHLTGPVVEISENDPEVVRIKGTRGLDKIDYYRVEKLDHQAIGDKYGVQTLVILRTWDFMYLGEMWSTLSLSADARMVDVRTGKVLWRKKVGTSACESQISRGRYSAATIKREFTPIVDCVVNYLSQDF